MGLKIERYRPEPYIDVGVGPGGKKIANFRCFADGTVQVIGADTNSKLISIDELEEAVFDMKDFVITETESDA